MEPKIENAVFVIPGTLRNEILMVLASLPNGGLVEATKRTTAQIFVDLLTLPPQEIAANGAADPAVSN